YCSISASSRSGSRRRSPRAIWASSVSIGTSELKAVATILTGYTSQQEKKTQRLLDRGFTRVRADESVILRRMWKAPSASLFFRRFADVFEMIRVHPRKSAVRLVLPDLARMRCPRCPASFRDLQSSVCLDAIFPGHNHHSLRLEHELARNHLRRSHHRQRPCRIHRG